MLSTAASLKWLRLAVVKTIGFAIELVCGGFLIGCVLVKRKAQHRGKKVQQQHKTSLDQLLVQHKCTVMGK